jgi:hypothetical protein
MKTLLRKSSNGLFFQGPDQWTSDPCEALNFKMIDRALEFVRKWNLKDVEVAFAFDDLSRITTVPLDRIGLHYSES